MVDTRTLQGDGILKIGNLCGFAALLLRQST
jgi:hypothetical protein